MGGSATLLPLPAHTLGVMLDELSVPLILLKALFSTPLGPHGDLTILITTVVPDLLYQ